MKVGVVGPLHPDSFADNVIDALESMGHDTVHLGTAGSYSRNRLMKQSSRVLHRIPTYVRRSQLTIARATAQSRPDLVINLEGQLLPETVEQIHRWTDSVVLWFPDAVVNLGRMLMFLAPYDAIFFKEPHLVSRCANLLGIKVGYLPEACNPKWHRPPEDTHLIEPSIVVAGNIYGYRAVLLDRLIEADLPLKLFGDPMASFINRPRVRDLHSGEYISRERKAQVFSHAAAVLNSMHPGEFQGVNCRLFEATACGALVVTEFRPELPKFFELDKEVVDFSTFEELVEQLNWALTHEGAGIRRAASTRAHGEHTYQHRLADLLAQLA